MFDDPGLRERLSELARDRRAGVDSDRARPAGAAPDAGAEGAAASVVFKPDLDAHGALLARDGVGVEAFLPGGEWRDAKGAVYVHERLRSQIEKRGAQWGLLGDPPEEEPDLTAIRALGLGSALFLDLETGGFSSTPVFLAGTMWWNGSDFVVRQYFARHYGEEAALLRVLAEAARGFEFLVTFNGKSYDAPFLRGRAHVHGERIDLPPRHLDLLHPARRRWKHTLRDCKLQTLEYYVCRRRRAGDVPSDEVPGLYHDFVRHGDPYRLIPVFHHNMLDVLTMSDVLAALCSPGATVARNGHDRGDLMTKGCATCGGE